jgi:hypothetical protein
LYVLRETVDIPNEVADPTFGEFATIYGSLRDEIAARAEHATPQF